MGLREPGPWTASTDRQPPLERCYPHLRLPSRRGAPSEREACPAPTPAASPTVTPTKMDERAAAEAADATVAAAPTAAPAACAPAPAAAACAPVSARAALEALAAQLGAAARGSGMAQAVAGTWEEVGAGAGWVLAGCGSNATAMRTRCPLPCTHQSTLQAFLAGVAVGLQLPSAGRRQTGIQRAMVLVLLVCGLAVVCGASLLVAGVAGQHPRAVFYS